MTAKDYKINFPYGATSFPYGTRDYPYHRGDDRPCPKGTPVVIGNTHIGLTGATGLVYDTQGNMGTDAAAHLHLQEWKVRKTNDRKPRNSFKGGMVTEAVHSKSDFGNYITIQNTDGWNDSYCHLSRIDVKVGQIITGGGLTMTPEVEASLNDLKNWIVLLDSKVSYILKQNDDLKNWELDTNKNVKDNKGDK